jgi:hypothetical protein
LPFGAFWCIFIDNRILRILRVQAGENPAQYRLL